MNVSLQPDSPRKTRARPRTALRLAAAALLGGGLLLGAAAARAEAASAIVVTTSVLATPVTYSRPAATPPLPTWAAWKVTVANNGKNVVNHITFTGATTVLTPGETAPFLMAEGLGGASVNCTATNLPQTAVNCDLGTLRSGGDAVSFVLIFKGPVAVAAPLPADRIDFAWQASYAEALSDNPGASRQDTQSGLAPPTALGTPLVTQVQSTVPRAGGTFFTGNTGVATAADPWTTTVNVPARLAYTTAMILEAPALNSCAPDLLTCNASTLTIPGNFSHLTITLRRDASTIKPGAKIANAKIYYASDNVTFTEVLDCAVTGGPQPGVPCMEARTAYTKKTAPTPQWEGDWEFVIRALDNGRYEG